MITWTPGRVRASGEAFLRELGRVRHLALRGGSGQSFRVVAESYAQELGEGALDIALDLAAGAAPGTEDATAARALLEWLSAFQIRRDLAPMDEWIAEWRATAIVRTDDGRSLPFSDSGDAIAGETNRAARLALDDARAALVERELLPTLVERRSRWLESVESLEIAGNARETAERVAEVDLAAVAEQARRTLARSDDVWRDSLARELRRRASLGIAEARPADLRFAVSSAPVDGAFTAAARLDIVRRSLREIGLSEGVGERLRIEPGQAAVARVRAECVPLDVPGDVRLVIGSAGGAYAYAVALSELGRALRFAHADADAPFEQRWLADPAAHAMCGRALALVVLDRAWLARYLDASRSEAATIARAVALAALHDLRRSCAVLLYRVQTLDSVAPAGALEEMFVEIVGAAVGVPPRRADGLLEAPPTLTPHVRLTATAAATALADEMVERFDADWYRNPRTGPWLVQQALLPMRGRLARDLVVGATGREPSLIAHVERLESVLAA